MKRLTCVLACLALLGLGTSVFACYPVAGFATGYSYAPAVAFSAPISVQTYAAATYSYIPQVQAQVFVQAPPPVALAVDPCPQVAVAAAPVNLYSAPAVSTLVGVSTYSGSYGVGVNYGVGFGTGVNYGAGFNRFGFNRVGFNRFGGFRTRFGVGTVPVTNAAVVQQTVVRRGLFRDSVTTTTAVAPVGVGFGPVGVNRFGVNRGFVPVGVNRSAFRRGFRRF
jgi:hypothetical protein